MTKQSRIIAGVVLGVVVIGLGGVGIASTRERGVEVRTEEVATRDLVSIVTASGVIQPKQKADISADISGRVIQIAVVEGQMVNRGDLLLRIDPTQYEALVRRSEAAVAQARAQSAQSRASLLQAQSAAERSERLAGGDRLISNQELEQARTQLRVAEAQEEAARYGVSQAEASLSESRETLRKTTIVAPMAGRVTRLNINEGETAVVGTMNNPGSLLLTIADLSVMEARVRVDETNVPRIAIGDSVNLKIDAFPAETFTGRVTRIANSAIQQQTAATTSQQAVDFQVIITLDAPPAELRPDLSATAEIVTDIRTAAPSVPIIAVTVRDPDGKKLLGSSAAGRQDPFDLPQESRVETEGVFVVRDGKAHFVPVTLGIAGDRYFELVSGVQVGDTVVAGPYASVRDLEQDSPVRVQQPARQQPANGPTAEAR